MVSNSALKENKLTLTFVSETGRFQDLYRLVSYFSYFRFYSKKSVDITIQQMIKFDVLSASFIFLLTLFYSFKARYKEEVYSFLIGQNLPGIAAQKDFKETSQYVLPFKDESFLRDSQSYLNTSFAEQNLTSFLIENQTIKLKKKKTSSNKSLIFKNKNLCPKFYDVEGSNALKKNGKFISSIYPQTKSFSKNKIETAVYKTNSSSPYSLTFQSFATQNFALSIIKKLEKEGTYLKFSELPLNCNSYFGVFQKKGLTSKPDFAKQGILKFPQKEGSALQNQIYNKSLLSLTKSGDQNSTKIYKQKKIITNNLSRESRKDWFWLGQNKSSQMQWFSFYENNFPQMDWDKLKQEKKDKKFKTQSILLDKLSSVFSNINTSAKPLASHSDLINKSSFQRQTGLAKPNSLSVGKDRLEESSVRKKKETNLTSTNWWHLLFDESFSLNSNFIVENVDFPFSYFTKGSIFPKQKQESALTKGKIKFSYENFRLNHKWKKKIYQHYLKLDEFPLRLSSITPFSIRTKAVVKRKNETTSPSQKKSKSFGTKQRFILRGSKSILNSWELGVTEQNRLASTNSESSVIGFPLKEKKENIFLQRDTYHVNKHSGETVCLPKDENKIKTLHLSHKSTKLSLLQNEIKAIFSPSKNSFSFIEKEFLDLFSNKLLISLDEILLNNSVDTLFKFLPQKNGSTEHRVSESIDKSGETLLSKNFAKQGTKKGSFLTQEDTNLVDFNAKSKTEGGENSEKNPKYTKKLTQLLQNFWLKKEDTLTKHPIEKIKGNRFPFFIKYLNTQPRLMSGYQFPDLGKKEINKLIKYSDSKKSLTNKTFFIRDISFLVNGLKKKKVSRKEVYRQHPVDVYLPTNHIQKLPQDKYTHLQKNRNLIELNNDFKVYQVKPGENLVLQNKILETDFEKETLVKTKFFEGKPYLRPLKFICKSLRLENSTEKPSFFVYQVPALLKPPSIWNPKLQKLRIAKTINKSRHTVPSIDFSKNLLSSTNFLTDRKQYFFATGNQVEKEQENSFTQRPLSGALFGLSYNQEKLLVDKIEINKNLQGKPLFKIKLQNKREQTENFNFRKKDFSILPLLSKINVKEKAYPTDRPGFTPMMPSLQTASSLETKKSSFAEQNLVSLEINSRGDLQEANKISKTLLAFFKTYKTYPKSFKPITGINFYSFFDISAFHPIETLDLPSKSKDFQRKPHEISADFTQSNSKLESLPFTKRIVENSKLNIKRKQLSDKCDKQINTLHLVLPFLETDTFTTTWTKWLSSRYKKPAIPYSFQKRVFYLPSNKKVDFFLQQKNRYQKNKWGQVEQQENRNKKGERDEDSLTSFSEQVNLPITIKRSLHLSNTPKIWSDKNLEFSFFTTKPLFLQSKTSKIIGFNSEKKNLNVVDSQNSSEENSILPHKRLSFVPKNLILAKQASHILGKPTRQKQNKTDTLFRQKTTKDDDSFLYKKSGLFNQITPLSYFLSDTTQKSQASLSYLKRFDTNCDRLDWQSFQWHPLSQGKYTYSPPSQSTLNEEFLNSFFKNKLKKKNTIYKYNRHLPILKFHYVKKNLLPKVLTSFSLSQKAYNSSEVLSSFKKTYSLSYLQNKQSFFNLLFPKKKRALICWEPITIRSWMVVTQYCYAFFLIQSALYVYEKHMKKVLLSFAPLLSGRGILSGMPSFGEQLQDFLGGSTIDKNVLLFKKIPKRFQDIVAIDNKLPQLSEIVWFLRNFGRTANVNKIQGVLFVGPPGTGKTLLVQAIAGEAEVPVLVLSGSSFADGKKDKKGGQLLKRVFQRARILAPSILFIDEIDTLGESRSHFAQDERDQKNESSRIIESISHTEERIQGKTPLSQNREKKSVKQVGLLTQFLVEMDGLARQQKNSYFFNNKVTFGKHGGILVIGSTNRPKVLDPALTRPGRFDQVFYLSNPGKQKRIEILKVYTKNIGVSSFLPWDYLGDRTLGFSAADLSAIVNKSTIRAILSHTIHTIQSIEEGIESLPKLSQNQNKYSILGENNFLSSEISLGAKKRNNENTILCKSIFASLLICTKRLHLQNKYKNFTFCTDQYQISQNLILQRGTTEPKLENSKEFKNGHFVKQNVKQQSISGLTLQKNKRNTEFDHSLGIGISFLSRLPFYQAGKVMVQILLSKDPITLVATLCPKQELSFSNMFKESIHVKGMTNRDQLETRLITGYAGKAAETLLVSGLRIYKNQSDKTVVTWQSTLGVEEWKLTNSLACSMISKYYFYSQKIITQKEDFITLSQNSNEILETENFQILENIFSKEELKFSQEKQDLQLIKGKNDIVNTIGGNNSLLNPIIWVSNLYQQYEITKIFGHIEENNWYQVYLPPLVKDEQNKEWVPLDQYYYGRENLIELIWTTYKNKSINWSELYRLDHDLTYQGLVLYHFNKALSLLDKNRELLDLFANLLLSFRTIRRHEILRILSYFKYYDL